MAEHFYYNWYILYYQCINDTIFGGQMTDVKGENRRRAKALKI